MEAPAGPVPVRSLTSDTAHVLVTGGTRPPGQDETPADRASVVSFVLVREAGDWKIAAFQNTRAAG